METQDWQCVHHSMEELDADLECVQHNDAMDESVSFGDHRQVCEDSLFALFYPCLRSLSDLTPGCSSSYFPPGSSVGGIQLPSTLKIRQASLGLSWTDAWIRYKQPNAYHPNLRRAPAGQGGEWRCSERVVGRMELASHPSHDGMQEKRRQHLLQRNAVFPAMLSTKDPCRRRASFTSRSQIANQTFSQ
eukprot:768013-Hanusia_phi.AAC.6